MAKNYKTPEVIKQYGDQMADNLTKKVGSDVVDFYPVQSVDIVLFRNKLTGSFWFWIPVDELLNAETNFDEKFGSLRWIDYEPIV